MARLKIIYMVHAIAAGLDCKFDIINARTAFLHDAIEEKNGTIPIDQRDYIEDVIKSFYMKGCNLAFKPGKGPKLSLYQ